ncbi:insulin-related peptide 2-like isoform X2 [Bicyclus anynana]|uniref:Insulin-related peptide 2-like isoform X2 n=1 Tax=Bicyclus anynana TaxID=110368 RepID=A0A6J1MXC5_BICAN|nr:insulin-related peptide 2-like isoform X2 [Bicyclus anynana]
MNVVCQGRLLSAGRIKRKSKGPPSVLTFRHPQHSTGSPAMKLQTILLLLACLGMATAASTQSTFCGRRLSSALELICESGWRAASRAAQPAAFDAGAAAAEGARSKRHVVAECCEQPCSLEQLMAYC